MRSSTWWKTVSRRVKHRLSDEAHWFWKTDAGFQWVLFLDIFLWSTFVILLLK